MRQDEWKEFANTVKGGMRQHADYFSDQSNRDIAEAAVVRTLDESLAHDGKRFFHSVYSRGKGEDPPDCEAISLSESRIGIEVTELVDEESIRAVKQGLVVPWEPFSKDEISRLLDERIRRKDDPKVVKGGPYDLYVIVIFCDEPRVLDCDLLKHIEHFTFGATKLIDRAFLLFSYDPRKGCCPYLELKIDSVKPQQQ